MAHQARAEGLENETTDEEDAFQGGYRRDRAPIGTDEYIERVVGSRDDDDTDSDIEIVELKSRKGKDKNKDRDREEKDGERVKWSDDDEDSDHVYERFKARKTTKRKKDAATKKKRTALAKDLAANRQKEKEKANEKGEPVKKKQRMWGDASDNEPMDDDIPEYILGRRREFNRGTDKLGKAGLWLPPVHNTIDLLDDDRLENLEERPEFPATLERSQKYEDVVLPASLGVIPASIAQYLRDYQIEGVKFIHELFIYQRGGILGDDMGLGKTVQVVAFLTTAFGKTGDERDKKRMRKFRRAAGKPWYPRVLIVCPGSLIQNWINELNRWGWWHVDKYHGNPKERESVLMAAQTGHLEILVTTYTTYRNHMGQLNLIPWDCVVADECHQLKERTSLITQAMNEVNALCRIGLTGTAIQNKYSELWTLLNWCCPGQLGPLSTWESSISEPLRQGQSHDATFHQLKRARETAEKLVKNLLPQFFLRRMKSLIAHQLPKKTDRVVFCPLTEIQKEAYELFLESDIVELVKYSTEICGCNSGKKRGWCCYSTVEGSNTSWKALVFPVITNLQKLSNHLALLIPNAKDPPEKQERDLDSLKKMVPSKWRELYANRESLFNLANPDFCGKWKLLKRLLKQWYDNGDKVLIFSHSVRLLKILHHLFNHTSYNVSFLSGEMHVDDRQQTVDDFNSDPNQFVFLISTKAGGVGLNITSANKVVIFDPNWNPSYDLQAQDRAYRIGQLRDVEVFRLVSAGTVEEIVYARQIYKQQQANIGYKASLERRYFKGVQNSSGQKGEIFGLTNLLTFHGDDVVLRDIVNKTNVAEAKRGIDMVELNTEDLLNDEDDPLKKDDDDGDRAMSQLVALIEEGEDLEANHSKPRSKMDPIAAILASAGVQYTHENSEVVGSSRIETELSRRAQETGGDVDFGEQRLFAESQSQRSDPNKISYTFQPPEDVIIRQFCTMAKTFGFESATEFALIVESWTQKQRRDCLERFYLKRRDTLAALDSENSELDKFNGTGVSGDSFTSKTASEVAISRHDEGVIGNQIVGAGDKTKVTQKTATPPDIAAKNVIGSDTESDEDDEL